MRTPLILALALLSPTAFANPELNDSDVGSSLSTCPVTEDSERSETAVTAETPDVEAPGTVTPSTETPLLGGSDDPLPRPTLLKQLYLVEELNKHLPRDYFKLTAAQYQNHFFHIATLLPQIQETLAQIGGYEEESAAINFYYATDFSPHIHLIFLDTQTPHRPMILREYVAATRRARRTLFALRREIPAMRRRLGVAGRPILRQLGTQIRQALSHMNPVIDGDAFLRY